MVNIAQQSQTKNYSRGKDQHESVMLKGYLNVSHNIKKQFLSYIMAPFVYELSKRGFKV